MKTHTICALAAAWMGMLCQPAAAADCAPVLKAVRQAMAQPRVHSAIDAPLDDEARKAGFKQQLMHSIVIDKVQYTNAVNPKFSTVSVADASMRALATDLAAFEIETGCTGLGSKTIAGRSTQAYAMQTDIGRGQVSITLWVDSATGMPIRATTDEPDVDVTTSWTKGNAKAGPRPNVQEKPNGKRVVATHAYIYGADVKPPTNGQVDPVSLAKLQSLLVK